MSTTLEYFMSMPHWLDALTPPLQDHLDRLAKTTSLLLSAPALPRDDSDWSRLTSGTGGVHIIDVSNPASPQLVKTFATDVVTQGSLGFNVVRIANNRLVVATPITLNANHFLVGLLPGRPGQPAAPHAPSSINYRFVTDILVNGRQRRLHPDQRLHFSNFNRDYLRPVRRLPLARLRRPGLAEPGRRALQQPGSRPTAATSIVLAATSSRPDLAYLASTTSTRRRHADRHRPRPRRRHRRPGQPVARSRRWTSRARTASSTSPSEANRRPWSAAAPAAGSGPLHQPSRPRDDRHRYR